MRCHADGFLIPFTLLLLYVSMAYHLLSISPGTSIFLLFLAFKSPLNSHLSKKKKNKKQNLIWLLANTNLWSLRNMTSYLSIPGSVANHCLTYYLTILSFLLISFEVRLSDFFEIYKHSCRKRKQWFKKKKTLSFTFIEYQR